MAKELTVLAVVQRKPLSSNREFMVIELAVLAVVQWKCDPDRPPIN